MGQAVYVAGSFFNHSCQPNIHTYFLSRTLHVQATEYVLAGSELELSYGPQVTMFSYSLSVFIFSDLGFWSLTLAPLSCFLRF